MCFDSNHFLVRFGVLYITTYVHSCVGNRAFSTICTEHIVLGRAPRVVTVEPSDIGVDICRPNRWVSSLSQMVEAQEKEGEEEEQDKLQRRKGEIMHGGGKQVEELEEELEQELEQEELEARQKDK